MENAGGKRQHNAYEFGYLAKPQADLPAHSQPEVPRIQPCLLSFVLLSGGNSGDDQEQDHEEPTRPHQFDEMPVSQNRNLDLSCQT
jgi:hypothetical protein